MEKLAAGAAELGIHLSPEQLDQFETYFHELVLWNQRANLTSITSYGEVQVKHFLDSLTVCLAVGDDLNGAAKIIDIGSGAGLPGLPLKLVFPESKVEVVDSVGKKTAFLDHIIEMLCLEGVAVHTSRAEMLGQEPDMRESFDLALVRGVAKLPLLLEYALPFCRLGGKVVAWKHGDLERELAEASHALEELGGKLVGIYPVELEGLTDNRVVVAFEKVASTPARYPRRTGIPAKRPL
jgi:16S rRNA (guanine527-N7)-methyltransferase